MAKPRQRYGFQAMRIIAVLEAVSDRSVRLARGRTVQQIVDAVNARVPEPVCKRTVERDITALVELGYLRVTDVITGVGGHGHAKYYQRTGQSL